MAAQTSPLHPLTGGDRADLTVEDDGDPPQLPVMVPSVATVTSMASTGQTSANVTSSEIPAVVSITRVPAKPKQQEVPSGGGLKVRTDLGAPTQKPGPPPLLRVAGGPSPRPSLPPMPKLKLGGQRTTGPSNLRFQPPIQVPANPLNGVMINKTHQSQGNVTSQQTKVGAMPIITNSMSLRQLRPKPPQVPSLNPRFGNSPASRAPAPRQMATFIPQSSSTATTPPLTPTTRPVQVRTVFVPPPMKMKSPAPSPVSPSANTAGGAKKMNTFNLGIPASVPLATGISITPISKSNGLAPVIKGVDAVNGVSPNKSGEEETYDDIELDDDDEGAEENATKLINNNASHMATKGSETSPIITNVTSLRKEDSPKTVSNADLSNQKAKKSFRSSSTSEQFTITLSPKITSSEKSNLSLQSVKRPLDSSDSAKNESIKKFKIDSANILTIPKPIVSKNGLIPEKKKPSQSLPTQFSNAQMSPAEPLKDSPLESEYICQAIENVGGQRVGCKNKVTRFELVKLTSKCKALLCDLHRDRLARHSCCPLCGEFCSHGLVYMCRTSKTNSPHLFHRSCYNMKSRDDRMCPHCGSRRPPMAVQLKMTMSRAPLKLLSYTAKMSSTIKANESMENWEVLKARENFIHYTLPNGKVISADGIPKGLESSKMEEILETFNSKNNAKVTTRDMYKPTAAGDNVKLLQLLALDYSPRQKFPEVDGGSPLHVAAANNHPLTAHILLQAGADIDAFDDNNETPLMIAAYNGYPNIVRYFITAGAKVELKSDDGMTALHLAAQNGHLECCHIILGANKLPRNHINVKDDGGWTPLVWACEHKHEGVIRYLIDQGADPFTTDVEMNVALHWAAFSGKKHTIDKSSQPNFCFSGSKDTVELLLAAGSNVNQANGIGETPLHIALRQDHYECALYLINRGSRLDVANNQGQLPSHCIDEEKSKAAGLIQLGTTLQKLMNERKSKFLPEKNVSADISNGKETIPITAINGEDLENGPSGYVYVKNNVVTNPLPIDRNIAKLQHCKCKDNCVSEDTCKCCDISLRSWYDSNSVLKDGFDFSDPPMIFECNDMCSCNINSCNNRVVQHGITARMQVYKTYGMGWGVKSLVDIPKGGFVCEYVGELISDAEAEQRENDSYLFDLENRDGDTFCIDANKFGNVTRFINHSCDPNLIPVKVFTSHQDLRFPHIAMFASRDIKRGDVLGFDYGEKFWVIKHKFFTCWCGLDKCKYSKTAIGRTLDNYYKKNDLLKCPEEEQQKQTGRLKLKLKMEEGKVVEVDDSLLLPGDAEKKKIERRPSDDRESSKERAVENGKQSENNNDIKKNKKIPTASSDLKRLVLCKEKVIDELDSSDSDASKKSDRSSKKGKEKSVETDKALQSLKEKITEIQGQIFKIESKKNDKSGKVKEKSVERIFTQKAENKFEEKKVLNSIDLESSRDTAETDKEVAEAIAREVTDLVINKIEREALKKSEDKKVSMINHENENKEILTPLKTDIKDNQCPKCMIVINRAVKLKKHARLCKGKSSKVVHTKSVEDKVDSAVIGKQLVKLKNIDESTISDVQDANGVDELKNGDDSINSSVLESNIVEAKKKPGRPKKPMVDVNNIMEKLPSSASHLKRTSRSSSSSLTPTKDAEAINQENSGRPKRARKAVDKDL